MRAGSYTRVVPEASLHARARLRQRGFRQSDIDLSRANGTPCEEATVLAPSDVERVVAERRREIAAFERLRETAVIVDESALVTASRSVRPGTRYTLGRADRQGGRSVEVA